MTELERRQKATEATMQKYGPRPFAWGSADCAKMVGFHLKRLGKKVSFSKAGPYHSALQAKRALKKLGVETLPEALDQILPRYEAPAFALMGDIVSFPSDDPIGGLGIVLGNGNMMCYHESHEIPVVMTMEKIDAAWKAHG